MKYILGIDLGKAGGLCFMTNSGEILYKTCMPIHIDKEIDHYELEKLFAKCMTYAKDRDNVSVVMEKVGAMAGNGANSMFSFGRGTGYIMALVHTWFGRDTVEVNPAKWQKWLVEYSDITPVLKNEFTKTGKQKRDTKKTVIKALKKLYKDIDLTKSKQATKDHDGIADAVAIALWGIHNEQN